MELWKSMPKWLRIVLIILLTFCVFADIWYFAIKNFKEEKEITHQFFVSTLKDVELDSEKNIINVNYYANKDNSGKEMFEIKFNYFMTEDSNDVLSAGIQMLADEKPLAFSSVRYQEDGWANSKCYYRYTTENEYFQYNTHDEKSYTATAELGTKSSMLITINDKEDNKPRYYKIKFRGQQNEDYFRYQKIWFADQFDYLDYDVNYMAKLLLDMCKSQPYGTDEVQLFKFNENLFVYEKSNNDGTYTPIETTSDEASNVRVQIENYYYIRVKTYQRGANQASDSMFSCIAGQFNYGEGQKKEYYNATQIINLTEDNFIFCKESLNNYKLKFNDFTINKLEEISKASENFALKIILDKQRLDKLKVNPIGFVSDPVMTKYKIYSITLINGETQEVLEW